MKVYLEYEGPTCLKANQLFRSVLRLIPDFEIKTPARVVVAFRHVSDLGDAQMRDPSTENFITVKTEKGHQEWKLGPCNDWQRHPWNRGIDLHLVSGTVPKETAIIITLGDSSGGCKGYRSQSFTESAFRFRCALDVDGKGNWIFVEDNSSPSICITGNRASHLRLVVSPVIDENNNRRVHLKPEDLYGNIAGECPDRVDLSVENGHFIDSIRLNHGQATVVTIPDNKENNWKRLTALTTDGALFARSNPFGSSPLSGYKLFFGEIHGQSGLCDGTNSPSEIYDYAREAAGLDFASVTSHDFLLTSKKWEEIKRATKEANRPGEFVTFPGYEWSGQTEMGGDNNIYFMDDDAPLIYSAPYESHPAWNITQGQVKGSRNLRQVIEELRGRRFMVVPHCGGRCCNLDFYDPEVMPLFEIHSCHRTYEKNATETIRRKIRFGFIGGSDDHRGALGDSHPAARDKFFSNHSGLVAVYAKELTRESLWEAFFSRRVYATNGPRIILSTSINGVPIGGEIKTKPKSILKMSFVTCLDGLLDRLEVIRNDNILGTFYGNRNQVDEFSGEMEISVADKPCAFYIKVFQTDGGRAWSSPIWVVPTKD